VSATASLSKVTDTTAAKVESGGMEGAASSSSVEPLPGEIEHGADRRDPSVGLGVGTAALRGNDELGKVSDSSS
jgi:hypothetical protein